MRTCSLACDVSQRRRLGLGLELLDLGLGPFVLPARLDIACGRPLRAWSRNARAPATAS